MPQIGDTLYFWFIFYKNFVPFSPASVAVQVRKPDGTAGASGAAVEKATGEFLYATTSDAAGQWQAKATSSDSSVDLVDVYDFIMVDTVGLAVADVQTALTNQGYTTTRAVKLDNLDTTVSSRAATGATITYSGPVAAGNINTTLYAGDDYNATLGNALTYTISNTPADYSGGTAKWFGGGVTATGIVSGNATTVTVTVTLTAAETASMPIGHNDRVQLEITKSGYETIQAEGKLTVRPKLG